MKYSPSAVSQSIFHICCYNFSDFTLILICTQYQDTALFFYDDCGPFCIFGVVKGFLRALLKIAWPGLHFEDVLRVLRCV